MAPKKQSSQRSFDDRYDDQYNYDDYDNPRQSYDHDDYEVTYDDHRRRQEYKQGNCCSIPKLAVFFIFLGLTFGLVFGFVDLDKINNLINNNSTDTGDGGGGEDGGNNTITDDNTVIDEPYQFMQCPTDGSPCCNGLASNCDLRPQHIMWATVHNANHDKILLPNHEAPLEEALQAGYRGLMLDACLCPDVITGELVLEFCHSVCNIGKRDPTEVFTNINTFLEENPTEVIFINFEISSGSPSPALIWEHVKAAGLQKKAHILGQSNFPTLGNMVANGKQLILAKHRGMDCTDTSVEGCTPRIFEYFNQVVENHYDFDNVAAIEDSANSCIPFRGQDGTKKFYSINNFVTAHFGPSKVDADIVNEKSFLEKRIEDCKTVTGYDANIVSVDFWQRGDLPRVTQEINIARAASRRSLIRKTIDKALDWFHL